MSLTVIKPGMLSSFQDRGRDGYQHQGIPPPAPWTSARTGWPMHWPATKTTAPPSKSR